MKSRWAISLGVGALLAGFLAPIVVALRQQAQLSRFHVVRDGVLYRSAQLPLAGLERVLRDHGIRTVITLRDSDSAADQAEEAFCRTRGIRFVRIPPRSWDGVQGSAPVEAGLRRFLDEVQDPTRWPVLVHCFRGVHRTGQYVAVYRVECEGWTVEHALNEMVDHGYQRVHLEQHRDVQGYFASYKRTGKYRLSPRAGRMSQEVR